MGQLLLLRSRPIAAQPLPENQAITPPRDPGAPARGIVLALAMSAVFWAGLGLGVRFLAATG
jgi:hypothetical protein